MRKTSGGGGLFLLLALLTFPSMFPCQAAAQDLTVRTYVDRVSVPAGQQFILTVEISGAEAQAVPFPKLPDLSAFADYLGSSTSQSVQIINNKMSVSKSTASYYYARAEGKHEIPAVTVSFGGKSFGSQPIALEIIKGDPAGARQGTPPPPRSQGAPKTPESTLEGNLYLQAEVDRRSVFQNQPVNVVFKIYTRVEVAGFNVTRRPDLEGFWSEDFAMPQRTVTYERVVDGKKFLVAEILRSSLFPTTPGEKVIDPLEGECEVRLPETGPSRNILDRFFEDDFFGSGIFGRRVRTKVASKPVTITVKPLPEEGRTGEFSGMVGQFSMAATLDKDEVPINEAVTLKVRVSGTGNIKMIPEPSVSLPSNIEAYEPKVSQDIQRSGGAVKGNKTFEYVLIPRLAGEYRIRSFPFVYFDPAEGSYQRLRSPEFLIRASAGPDTGITPPSGLSREEIRLIGQDIRFIKQAGETYLRIGDFFYQKFWFFLLLVLPPLFLGGAVFYRRRLDLMAVDKAYARSCRANRMARRRLSQARRLMNPETQKEFYAEISRALLGFVADKLNLAAAGLISDEVALKLRERQVEEGIVTELIDCLRECDFQRFAPSDSSVDRMRTVYGKAAASIVRLDRARLGA